MPVLLSLPGTAVDAIARVSPEEAAARRLEDGQDANLYRVAAYTGL
jgi:hypothetical protein